MSEDPTVHWLTTRGIGKKYINKNVYEAALERIDDVFNKVDRVAVTFSGGKDSTVTMQLALEVSRARNKLPLPVILFDEEVIDPDTIAYMEDVMSWDEIEFYWFAVPIRHTLRSYFRSWWWPWDPAYKDDWARDIPDYATTDVIGFVQGSMTYVEGWHQFVNNNVNWGRVGMLAGIRTEESFNRQRALMGSGDFFHEQGRHIYAKPIYDWHWQDIWRAIRINNWPYSDFYNRMLKAGVSPGNQRVAPWGNAAQTRQVKWWPVLYPDFWDRAIRRMPELRAQARYGMSKLYRQGMTKPTGITWQEYTWQIISNFDDPTVQEFWTRHIRDVLRTWDKKNTIPFPEEPIPEIVEATGEERIADSFHCWKYMAYTVSKNDLTGRDKK